VVDLKDQSNLTNRYWSGEDGAHQSEGGTRRRWLNRAREGEGEVAEAGVEKAELGRSLL
jgi:hypothetical protein